MTGQGRQFNPETKEMAMRWGMERWCASLSVKSFEDDRMNQGPIASVSVMDHVAFRPALDESRSCRLMQSVLDTFRKPIEELLHLFLGRLLLSVGARSRAGF